MKTNLTILLCTLICGALFAQSPAMLKRRAFREQLENPATRSAAIQAGLSDEDVVIRKKASFELLESNKVSCDDSLKKIILDQDKSIRDLVIAYIRNESDMSKKSELANFVIANSEDENMKLDAKRLLATFTLYRENVRLKDNPTFDHMVSLASKSEISDDNWIAIKDVDESGHEKGYFKTNIDEKKWKKIKIGAWEKQCIGEYNGIAWYRIRFKAPEKTKELVGAELFFKGIDEVAWIWLNEVYVGQHDLGQEGWNIPFFMNITDEIKWGEENLLVVRVHDSVSAGGIWQPIELHLLK